MEVFKLRLLTIEPFFYLIKFSRYVLTSLVDSRV